MEQNEVDIGKLIQKVVRDTGMRDAQFAKLIGKTRQNVYDLYQRSNIDVKFLLTISKVLDYDFFQHFRLKSLNQSHQTDVSIQFKVQSENLDELLKWISENGDIQLNRKK